MGVKLSLACGTTLLRAYYLLFLNLERKRLYRCLFQLAAWSKCLETVVH
jgi:hypothetical protein